MIDVGILYVPYIDPMAKCIIYTPSFLSHVFQCRGQLLHCRKWPKESVKFTSAWVGSWCIALTLVKGGVDEIDWFVNIYPPEVEHRPLKIGGWKAILSFWGPAYFQGRTVSFREGMCLVCACCFSDASFDFVDMDQLLPQTNRILPTIRKLPCFLFRGAS